MFRTTNLTVSASPSHALVMLMPWSSTIGFRGVVMDPFTGCGFLERHDECAGGALAESSLLGAARFERLVIGGVNASSSSGASARLVLRRVGCVARWSSSSTNRIRRLRAGFGNSAGGGAIGGTACSVLSGAPSFAGVPSESSRASPSESEVPSSPICKCKMGPCPSGTVEGGGVTWSGCRKISKRSC
jgi:hypothetical protein